jgi:hypothetical protein
MHLNREQKIAMDFVKNMGMNPVNAIVLTSRHSRLGCSVVSVSAIQGDIRFNARVGIDTRSLEASFISIESLKTIIDYKYSPNPATINGCIVSDVERRLI